VWSLAWFFFLSGWATQAQKARWTEKDATDCTRSSRGWLGSNYIPANAINELEMWQADSFDPKRIDMELGWAEAIGLNTMRVFLARFAVAAGRAGIQKAHQHILADCGEAPYQAAVCAV